MRDKRIKETKELIERFFNGETTVEEERRLYRIFRRQSLPAEIERYREVFRAFGSMQSDAPRRAAIVSIALRAMRYTAVAMVLILGAMAYQGYHEERMLARIYGGSYVIENGRRIDDLSRIQPYIKMALSSAEDIEESVSRNDAVRQAELDVLNSIDDPKERERINRMLNE